MKNFSPGKLLLIGLLLICSVPLLICTSICQPYQGPPAILARQIPLEKLLIDDTVFPPGWKCAVGKPGTPPLRIGERISREFFPQTNIGLASHEVYRCRTAEAAAAAYADTIDSYFFSPWEIYTSWSIPPELSYESTVADQFRVGCRIHIKSGIERCQAIAQYDEYIVRFAADMSGVMTYDDFERILQAIDERMAYYLGKEIERVPYTGQR